MESMARARMLVCAALFALTLTACTGPADGNGATVITKKAKDSGSSSTAADEAEAVKPGMREDPLAVGQTAKIGDWEVMLVSVEKNADAAVAKANSFNEPAPEGSHYVLINLEATYAGEESGTFWTDVSYKILGSKGNTFDSSGTMAVTPKPISDTGETFPGASVAGDTALAVPDEQLDGAMLILEESFGGSRTFFALD